MPTFAWDSIITLLGQGADLTGLCLLTSLLAVSAWTCLRPQPLLRRLRPSAGERFGFYMLLCALAAPLLMFASLALGLGLMQEVQPAAAPAGFKSYRGLLWMLYALVGLQQLFALQRLGFWPEPKTRRMMPLTASALALIPLAMGCGLLALDRLVFLHRDMPPAIIAVAALAAVSGIVLWLPMQWVSARAQRETRAEPALAGAAAPTGPAPAAAMVEAPPDALSRRFDSAREMERQLNELTALLEEEKRDAEQASQRELLQQDEALRDSTIQQQVHEQRFLFESGLPCNLGMLVNGLVILDQPLDLRDHVRGDSLLHAVVREGGHLLAQQLIDNGAALDALNWAGLAPRACTQDPAMLALLDEAATRVAK